MSHWRSGSEEIRRRVESWLAGSSPGEEVADNSRRLLVRLTSEASTEPDLLVKIHRVATGAHPRREGVKRRLGCTAAQREWRWLQKLSARQVAVPQALGLASLVDGDELLVRRYQLGRPLRDVLNAPHRERRRILRQIGRLATSLHAAGATHGDLHAGNILVGPDGPMLLDLQRARGSNRGRWWDLACLDFSLQRCGLSTADRIRVVTAALPVDVGPDEQRARRTIARLSRIRARRYYRSRTRRSLRSGRRFARTALGAAVGMRTRDFSNDDLADALKAHREAPSRNDSAVLESGPRSLVTCSKIRDRTVVVKEVRKGGVSRLLADAVRGSPARRAWLGGHGLLARDIPAARPLAFVETRSWGLSVESIVVLESLDTLGSVGFESASADRLCDLLVALHSRGVIHGDLKWGNLRRAAEAPVPALIDLEGVRFANEVSEQQRIMGLAQLNASLADAELPTSERVRAFHRYTRSMPFSAGRRTALARVVRESLARDHMWRGTDCDLTEDC